MKTVRFIQHSFYRGTVYTHGETVEMAEAEARVHVLLGMAEYVPEPPAAVEPSGE